MINKIITIQDWIVTIIIATDTNYDYGDILQLLYNLGCSSSQAKEAYITLTDESYNIGFTYSNYFTKQSILFIGIQDSDIQLINTICHESRHLQQHISNLKGLDENSEDVCYLIGYIASKIYQICKSNNLI